MAPRTKKQAPAKSPKKVAAANGQVSKAKKPAPAKKLTTPAKKTVKATAAEAKATKAAPAKATKAAPAKATKETPVKATKAAPAKKAGAVDAYLLFEVCKSCHTYKRTANQVFADICAAFPKKHFEIVINEHGLSRRGSFEVTVSKKKGSTASAQLIWSGISKGPPRKLKFPDAAQLIESVKSAV